MTNTTPDTITNTVTQLPGQQTMLACWSALAEVSPKAHLRYDDAVVAAVFPSWDPLNNAIALTVTDGATATEAAAPARLSATGRGVRRDGLSAAQGRETRERVLGRFAIGCPRFTRW